MKLNCGPTREENAVMWRGYISKWHPWFAWRPIRVGPRDCRWLETIERKWVIDPDYGVEYFDSDLNDSHWEYRAKI